MKPEIVVGILSCCGTLIGTIGGIMASNRLTVYRIQELEKKVDKHNTVIERMTVAEIEIKENKEGIKENQEKIRELKEKNDLK